jgi:hypothetical protein
MNYNLVLYVVIGLCFILFTISTIVLIIARSRAVARSREWRERYESERSGWEDRFNRRCGKLQRNFEAEHIHLLAQALVGKSFQTLEKRVSNRMEKKYQRLKQSVLGNLSDKSDGLIRNLRSSITSQIWGTYQQYKEKAEELPIVWPRNMRITFSAGNATVLMLEQEPQVRSVIVNEKVAGRSANHATEITEQGNFTYRLAFPYIYFLVLYLNGRYSSVEAYFANKSITDLMDTISDAPLPNIHYRENIPYVCMGNDFAHHLRGKSFAEQNHYIISEFWQRSFNMDLGRGGYDDIDGLRNLKTWQKNSEEDPTFVLGLRWPKKTTVKAAIDRALSKRSSGSLDMASQEIQNQLKTCAELVSGAIGQEIEAIKNSLVLEESKADAKIREDLEAVVTEHARNVFFQCTSIP